MDGQGQFGFEASGDSLLTGIDGRSTEDVSTDGQLIPGTVRDEVEAIDGSDVKLTLDLDLQTYVQQKLERSEEHTSELQSRGHLVCRLLLEKKKTESR